MKRILASILFLAAAAVHANAQTTLSGNLFVYPSLSYTKTSGTMTATATWPNQLLAWAVTSGTNANQMNALASAYVSLTNHEVRVFNLLAMTNAFGDVITFDRVNFIAVKAATNNAALIYAGSGGVDNMWMSYMDDPSSAMEIRPGGLWMMTRQDAAGWAVATNACNFQLQNTGTNTGQIVELYIGGAQ